ncbi:metallophosphoesterase [Sorangium sp. So ce388]|uniref:metallophosphoesterase n=1 Tax=Sorangium sp. So ce388 TaxID=3133309 RepID=UPI003F5C30EB
MRILHISDIHFGPSHYREDWPQSPERLAEDILEDLKLARQDPVDVIVASGDIGDRAERREYQAAKVFLRALAMKPNHEMTPIVVVPGNHDVEWKPLEPPKCGGCGQGMPTQISGSQRESSFTQYRLFFNEIRRRHDEVDDWCTDWWTNGEAFVLGLNSCVVDSPARQGQGYVDPEQLRATKRAFEATWSTCRIRVAVLHHHVLPVSWTRDGMNQGEVHPSLMLNADHVVAWLVENGFQAVLHGHQHQPFVTTVRRHNYDIEPVDVRNKTNPKLLVAGAGSIGASHNQLGNVRRRSYQILSFEPHEADIMVRREDEVAGRYRFEKGFQRTVSLELIDIGTSVQRVVEDLRRSAAKVTAKMEWHGRSRVLRLTRGELLSVLPSVLRGASWRSISTATLPSSIWKSPLGEMLLRFLHEARERDSDPRGGDGGELRRIFIGGQDEQQDALAVMDEQQKVNIKSHFIQRATYGALASMHLPDILNFLQPIDSLSREIIDRILRDPALLSLAVYGGSNGDQGDDSQFIGFDYDIDGKLSIGFIFRPDRRLLAATLALLQAAERESLSLSDLSGQARRRPAAVLLGAHRWHREVAIREALSAGLRVVLVRTADDRSDVDPGVTALVNQRFALRDSADALARRLDAEHGVGNWFVLALDDYVCAPAVELSSHTRLPCMPPGAERMVRQKHELRERWNRYVEAHPDLPLRTVRAQLRRFSSFSPAADELRDFENRFSPTPSSVIIKPSALSASIEVHKAVGSELTQAVAGMLKRLSGWVEVARKAGIEIAPEVLVEEEIARADFVHPGAEFSAEMISFNGRHDLIGVTEKHLARWRGSRVEAGFLEVGHVFPAPTFPDALVEPLLTTLRDLLQELRVNYGISHWEFIVTPERRLALVEAQLRPGGDHIMDLVDLVAGRSPYRVLFDALSGRKVDTGAFRVSPGSVAAIRFLKPARPIGRVVDIIGLDEDDTSARVHVERRALQDLGGEERWSGPTNWNDRHAYALATDVNREQAFDRCREAAGRVHLFAADGTQTTLELA